MVTFSAGLGPCLPVNSPRIADRASCHQVIKYAREFSAAGKEPQKSSRRHQSLPVAAASVVGRPADSAANERLKASQPSEQSSSSLYGEPLCGRAEPLGATFDPDTGSVNFALFSAGAAAVTLCLFSETDLKRGKVTQEIVLDKRMNKSGDIWHLQLPGLDTSLLYGYKVEGLNAKQQKQAYGHLFDPAAVVLDPYAKGVISRREFGRLGQELEYARADVLGLAATWPQAACSLPGPGSAFDWEGDRPLNIPMEDLIIYEMHVRGFTWDASSGARSPGTYRGLVEKLDYIQSLGINAIELLPVHEFNELEYYQIIPGTDEYRFNFWGYSTVAFFAPMARYSQAALEGQDGNAVVNEFKHMVRECHKRGIEVILDVVFNHTAEGNEQGPTISFRGLDNRVYYMLAPKGQYYNYSGCGNTFNCNHPQVRKFILDCLRYWVLEMHIDGFRFDLASIMTRAPSVWHQDSDQATSSLHAVPGQPSPTTLDHSRKPSAVPGLMTDGAGVPIGTPLSDPALVEMISEDPALRNTKLIAEAWDCDGLNQVGAFPHFGGRWAEWNGRFRDTVRMFVKGTKGPWASAFASALCGSPTIYGSPPSEEDWWGSGDGRKWRGTRGPSHSVNFITAHDGFTLADLVAYNEKHNEANGEKNNDGENHNASWNCGEEGPTSSKSVQRLRARQQRNLAAALLLSQGVPMVLMGDEYGHSKGGNNNTYCHDSALNWFNWDQAQADSAGFARFFRYLANLRRQRSELRQRHYVGPGGIQWHGVKPGEPDRSEESRLVAFTLSNPSGGLYIAFNSSHLPTVVQLPFWQGRVWQPLVDTGKVAPLDFLQSDDALSEDQLQTASREYHMWTADGLYPMLPWSCCVLDSVPHENSPDFGPFSTLEAPTRPPRKEQQEPAGRNGPVQPAQHPSQAGNGVSPLSGGKPQSGGGLSAAREMASKISRASQGTPANASQASSPDLQALSKDNARLKAEPLKKSNRSRA